MIIQNFKILGLINYFLILTIVKQNFLKGQFFIRKKLYIEVHNFWGNNKGV